MGAMIRNDFVKKSEMKEDFVEKEGGDSLSSDGFLGRAKNHPLSKPMVYHDQERVKARGDGRSVMRSQEICWKGREAVDLMGDKGGTVG